MDKIIAWIKSKNWTTHTVIVAAVAAAAAFDSNQPLRDLILSILKNHPVITADLGLLVAAILKASHSSSPAGAVAVAQAIMDSPKAPSPEAVAAAQTSTK